MEDFSSEYCNIYTKKKFRAFTMQDLCVINNLKSSSKQNNLNFLFILKKCFAVKFIECHLSIK